MRLLWSKVKAWIDYNIVGNAEHSAYSSTRSDGNYATALAKSESPKPEEDLVNEAETLNTIREGLTSAADHHFSVSTEIGSGLFGLLYGVLMRVAARAILMPGREDGGKNRSSNDRPLP